MPSTASQSRAAASFSGYNGNNGWSQPPGSQTVSQTTNNEWSMRTNVGSSYNPSPPTPSSGLSNAGSAVSGAAEKKIIEQLTEPSGLTITLRSDLLSDLHSNLSTYDVDVLCSSVLDQLKSKSYLTRGKCYLLIKEMEGKDGGWFGECREEIEVAVGKEGKQGVKKVGRECLKTLGGEVQEQEKVAPQTQQQVQV